jgi:hypothetical protein
MTAAAFTGLAIGAALLGLAYFSSGQPSSVTQSEYMSVYGLGANESSPPAPLQGYYNCIVDGTFTGAVTVTLHTWRDATVEGKLIVDVVEDMVDIATPQTLYVGPLALGAGEYWFTTTGGDGSTYVRGTCKRVLK